MTTPEHPLHEALDEVTGAALAEVVRDREKMEAFTARLSLRRAMERIEETPMGSVRSADVARLSRLVEAAIAWDQAPTKRGSPDRDAPLEAAIRCEGENDDR